MTDPEVAALAVGVAGLATASLVPAAAKHKLLGSYILNFATIFIKSQE